MGVVELSFILRLSGLDGAKPSQPGSQFRYSSQEAFSGVY